MARGSGHVLFALALLIAGACGADAEHDAPQITPTLVPVVSVRPSHAPACITSDRTPAPSADELVHLPLSGAGPIGLQIASNGLGWVIASDSGDLIGVDLDRRCEVESHPAGSTLTTMTLGDAEAYVGQLDTAGGSQPLRAVDLTTGHVDNIVSNPVGGLAIASDHLLALEKSGTLRVIDMADRRTVGTTALEIDGNEHMEIVSDGSEAWMSSDHTLVRRVSLLEQEEGGEVTVVASVDASIEAGGGIPLDVDAGLVWGARADELWAIDPATNEVVRHIRLDDLMEIMAMDVADGRAWIAARHPGYVGTVILVDIATEDVLGEWPVSLPAAVKVTSDYAWVASYETDELVGIPRELR